MKALKKIFKWFFIVVVSLVVLVNLVIFATGRFYIYKLIPNTIFKGRLSPAIDEYHIFANRKINTGKPKPWPVSKNYNKKNIPSQYLPDFKNYETVAYVIIKNDSLYFEQYWDGYGDTSHSNSFSMAKSFTSILVGIAIRDGYIKSVNQKVSDFLPEFKTGMDSLLTIKDLLTMSSGMDFNESYINPFAYPAEAYYSTDLIGATLKYKVVNPPGKEFIYMSGNSTLLGYILIKATGKMLSDYASEKLWQPIGAEHPAYWSLDNEGGIEKAYCCFNSNARDFARIGELYLNGGKWIDSCAWIKPEVTDTSIHSDSVVKPVLHCFYSQIVPEDYVKASITPKAADYYGYNWWILNCDGHVIPYCRGILGQYIFVIPDKHMVVVRLGKKRGPVEKGKGPDGKEFNVPSDGMTFVKAALDMYGR
jgi:CubicO group peptidase (beta-lactamase class C family)